MARIPIDVHGNTGFLGFEESCGPLYSISRGWTGILVEPISSVCHCGGLRKCVFMVWYSNMARKLNCLHGETIFSRCWGVFWFVIKHISQVKICLGLVSQHCVLLQLDQKVCIHGLIQCKWLEHWLALMAKPVFQVLRSLLDFSRSAFMGEKVFRWSQSALHHHVPLHWAQKSFYSRFNPSTNGQYMDWHLRTNCFTRFWRIESNGHVTDDVTWPWNDKLVTPICFERTISKTAEDAIWHQSLITW